MKKLTISLIEISSLLLYGNYRINLGKALREAKVIIFS